MPSPRKTGQLQVRHSRREKVAVRDGAKPAGQDELTYVLDRALSNSATIFAEALGIPRQLFRRNGGERLRTTHDSAAGVGGQRASVARPGIRIVARLAAFIFVDPIAAAFQAP